MLPNGNAGDLLVSVFCLAGGQQLQIVDENNLCFHPLDLCLDPSHTFAGFPIQNVFSVVLWCLCVSGTACGMKLNSRLDPKAAADPQNAFAAAPLETQ